MIKHQEHKELAEYTIKVLIPADEVKKKNDFYFNEALKKVKVPGYRPGKAPREKLEAYLDTNAISRKTVDSFLHSSFNDVVKYLDDKKIKALSKYSLDVNPQKDGSLEISYHFPMWPDFSKVDLKNLKAKIKLPKSGEKDKKQIIEEFYKETAIKEVVSDPKVKSKLTDTVNIDFKGFIDDEPFEGGEAEGVDLVLGSNTFIPGFEDQLVGKTTGWKGDIKVTFPGSYFVKEYQNKEAIFEVKINSITRLVQKEITDEIVKGYNLGENVQTKDQYLDLVFNKKLKEHFITSIHNFEKDIINEMLEIANPVVHPNLLEDAIKKLQEDFDKNLKQYGIKKKEYFHLVKSTEEDIQKEFEKTALEQEKKAYASRHMAEILPKDKDELEKQLNEFKDLLVDYPIDQRDKYASLLILYLIIKENKHKDSTKLAKEFIKFINFLAK
ncbi:trigger factor [Mycoplasma sp. 6243]|uniref:trigger factor n=1 Tax=Mycoplasma sp. 6243 TaxID=3440865 RepID=UPI003EB69A0F